jgi:hypothetical protein
MNLLQVIHANWAADGTLNGLLPVAGVLTGDRVDQVTPSRPYAAIQLVSQSTMTYFNDGAGLDEAIVRVAVYHLKSDYDEGLAIADAVKDAFHRANFDLSGSDKVLAMERAGYEEIQDEQDDWAFVIEFRCTVYLATGV